MRWFLGGALLVSGLHAGETFRLLFDSAGPEPAADFAAASNETAAESRS